MSPGVHAHSSSHPPPHQQKKLRLGTMIFAVIAGSLILAAKFYAARIADSAALHSDALEGTVNVLAAAFGLASIWWSEKPADADHPYGHGKIEYFAKAFEGGLISLAAVLILIDSIERLTAGHALQNLESGLWINLAAGAGNGVLGFILLTIGKRTRSEIIRADGIHLLTDLATTVGMSIGLGLLLLTGWNWIDPVIAVLVALFLLRTGFGLVKQSLQALLDAENPELIEQIVSEINEFQVNRETPMVITVHDLKAQEFGRDKHIDIHVVVPETLTIHEGHEVSEQFSLKLSQALGGKSIVHTHLDPCERRYCRQCPVTPCEIRLHAFEERPVITKAIATRQEEPHF